MPAKKRAKRPAPVRAPGNPEMARIIQWLKDELERDKKDPPETMFYSGLTAAQIVEIDTRLLACIDEFAADYKAYTRLDFTGVLRRFPGLRVVTNLVGAGDLFEIMGWGPGVSSPPVARDLDRETLSHYLTCIFAPERSYWKDGKHYDGLGSLLLIAWIEQAFVRDWRIRLGVQPTAPMLDWMLDKEVWYGPNGDSPYAWWPCGDWWDVRGEILRMHREAVLAAAGDVPWHAIEVLESSKDSATRDLLARYKRRYVASDDDGEDGDDGGDGEDDEDGDKAAHGGMLVAKAFDMCVREYDRLKFYKPGLEPWLPGPGEAGSVPNFVIVAPHDDYSYDWSFAAFVSRDGVLDLSADVYPASSIKDVLITPWCFGGLDVVRGVRELRMRGHKSGFYPAGYEGTARPPKQRWGDKGEPLVPRERVSLKPLVPPGAPLRESLEVLDLSGNYLDSLGLLLEGLVNLRVLHLDDTNITDAGALVATLAKHCPDIESVTLSGTLLDDEGMAVVAAAVRSPGVGWRGTGLHPEDT